MIDLNTGEDITDDVLTDIGYTFLLVAHRIEEADDSNIDLINEIYDYSVEHGYKFIASLLHRKNRSNCGRTRREPNILSVRWMILH